MATIPEPPLYLDTSHISRLVREPDSDGAQAVLRMLESGQVRLAVTLLHFHELSHPDFVDRGPVGELLDWAPLAWGRWMIDVFYDEVEAAIAGGLGTPRSVAPFVDSMEVAWGMPPEAVLPPSEALESMAAAPELRGGMLESMQDAAALDGQLKANAAVVRDPLQPLLARLREEHDLTRTPAGLVLPRPRDPEEVLRAAGGIEALPAYQTFQALGVTRLKDERFPTTANDIIDELHACYGPYSSVLLVDRATLGRLRSARLPFLDRCGRRLEDVPGLLASEV